MKKPGIKTSEFWLTFITSNVALLLGAFGLSVPMEVIGSVAAMIVGYAVSRGWVKGKETEVEDPE